MVSAMAATICMAFVYSFCMRKSGCFVCCMCCMPLQTMLVVEGHVPSDGCNDCQGKLAAARAPLCQAFPQPQPLPPP